MNSDVLDNLIEELVGCNCAIWANASQIKDRKNRLKPVDLSPQEQLDIFLTIRYHNSKRSRVRFEIDSELTDQVFQDTKLNYAK